MHVQVNSDNNIEIPDGFASQIRATVESALARYAEQITRIEVHLGDVNADKGGSQDKRCALEARLAGLQPITVSHHAGTIQHAIDGAAQKMQRALESALGKLRTH
jgi:ribosome-associated translation inhibitor RaiA